MVFQMSANPSIPGCHPEALPAEVDSSVEEDPALSSLLPRKYRPQRPALSVLLTQIPQQCT